MTRCPPLRFKHVGHHRLVLPVLALLDLLDELGPHELRPPGHDALGLGPQVQPFHQVVGPLRQRVLELAVESGRADQGLELVSFRPSRR